MGRILDNIRNAQYPAGIILGPKKNCLLTPKRTIIKETRYSAGMAAMGYHGHGNELHMFTFHNEIYWLDRLQHTDICPKLISYDDSLLTIEMSYVGTSLTRNNLPSDWKQQCDRILDQLYDHDCSHNDIKPDDILVSDDKLYLVDFGWASNIGTPIPDNWPSMIGGDFRYSTKQFNDKYSLIESIKYVINNGN